MRTSVARLFSLLFVFGVAAPFFSVSAAITNGMPATTVIGQYDADISRELRQIFTTNTNTSRVGLSGVTDVEIDPTDHVLFMSDTTNNRILVTNLAAGDVVSDRETDYVLGQTSFNGITAATTDIGLNAPSGMAIDVAGRRLFVADKTNNRVIVYNISSLSTGRQAANVLGQPSFTVATTGLTAAKMSGPTDVAFDAAGQRLFVSDTGNRRVLVFDVAAITNGEDAVNVLGQANLTSNVNATTAVGMSAPNSVAYDPTSTFLYVGESTINRVLAFNVSAITDGEAAVNVLGQALFTTATAGTTSTGLSAPSGLSVNVAGRRLYVSETTNNRVKAYDITTVDDNEAAVSVLGQALFTTATAATTQAGLSAPSGSSYNSVSGYLSVADKTNNRIMMFDVAAITDGEDAVDEVGQYDANGTDVFAYTPIYTKGGANDGGNRYQFSGVTDMYFDATYHRFFVSDSTRNRVLVYTLNSNNTFPDFVADFVLGQPDFNTIAAATTQTGLRAPLGLAFDVERNLLFVADRFNNRVMIWDVATISNGEAAVNELGHAAGGTAFTTSASALTQVGLNDPILVNYEPLNHRLFVGDEGNRRMMVFDLTTITDGEPAANVLGKPNFTTSTCLTTQAGMCDTYDAHFDPRTNHLFVSDASNHRVMVFDATTITDGEPAINVLGQASFTANVNVVNDSGLFFPFGLDGDETRLFVVDNGHRRTMVFDISTVTDNEPAKNVIGQSIFTTSSGATTQTGHVFPSGVMFVPSTSQLIVADAGRMLFYNIEDGSQTCFDPSAALVSPNGGATYQANEHVQVNFGYTGCTFAIRLSFSSDGGVAFTPIATLTTSFEQGVYDWTVPNISTTHGRLKIEVLDSEGVVIASDTSDADFTVQGTGSSTPPPITPPPPTNQSQEEAIQAFLAESIPANISEDKSLVASSTTPCVAHALIKGSATTVYYCGVDGKRYVFPNEKTFKTWYSDFSAVFTVSDAALATVPLAGNVTYKPHVRPIKIMSDTKVYAVSKGGVLHWITTEAVAQRLYGTDWARNTHDVSDAFFINYTVGTEL